MYTVLLTKKRYRIRNKVQPYQQNCPITTHVKCLFITDANRVLGSEKCLGGDDSGMKCRVCWKMCFSFGYMGVEWRSNEKLMGSNWLEYRNSVSFALNIKRNTGKYIILYIVCIYYYSNPGDNENVKIYLKKNYPVRWH